MWGLKGKRHSFFNVKHVKRDRSLFNVSRGIKGSCDLCCISCVFEHYELVHIHLLTEEEEEGGGLFLFPHLSLRASLLCHNCFGNQAQSNT